MPRTTVGLLALALLVSCAGTASAAGWTRPVAGPVSRPFSYGADPFRRGWHRGVDFGAQPGARIRAACSGRVLVARHVVGTGGVVTLSCGRWRVTELPIARVTARRGAEVEAGTPVGTLAPSSRHAGLHVGVRRAGDRFGYVDPMRFLGDDAPHGIPTLPGARRGPSPPPLAAPARAAPQLMAPTRPAHAVRARSAPAARGLPLAPWPAWAGLALVLAGVGGAGVRVRRRRPVARREAVAAAGPPPPTI